MNFEKMYTTIDAHVVGEGFRVIVHSPFQLQNQEVSEKEQDVNPFVIQAKQLLLNEPRGHRGVNGCIVIPSDKADFGVMFLNHEQENHFTYSGLVATLTVLLETGQIPAKNDGHYQIETVKGTYTVSAEIANQVVKHVQVNSVNCCVLETKDEVQLVEVDKARRYYLYPLPESIPTLEVNHLSTIMKWGKEAVGKYQDTSFHGIILVETLTEGTVRSVTFETDGVILRSPGFDSTCAIFAGHLQKDDDISQLTNQSIFGSKLTAVKHDTSEGSFSIKTQGFVTGEHRFIYDPEDPLAQGFLLK